MTAVLSIVGSRAGARRAGAPAPGHWPQRGHRPCKNCSLAPAAPGHHARSQFKLPLHHPACTARSLVCYFSLLLLLGCHVDVIPPESLTYNAMHMIKRRVLRYANTHNQILQTLDELPIIAGYDNKTTDGWGRSILYVIQEGEIIKLVSYGKDGQKGGVGEDADIIGTFSAKDAQGKWQNELCNWMLDPHKRVKNEK